MGSAQGRPQHHDEHEGRRQAGLASSRTARCRSSTSPTTPTRLTRGLRAARHARHLVRARVGRHAARAADPRHAPRRRGEDARDRRGSERAGARVQGRVLAASTATACAAANGSRGSSDRGSTRAFERDQGRCSIPIGLLNPGKIVDPPRMDDARAVPLPAAATAPIAASQTGARLVGVERAERSGRPRRSRAPGTGGDPARRLRQGRRDVQQQRPLPQVRRRHDVPELSRDARRAAPDARPRQHAAPGAVGPARRRVRSRRAPCATRSTCASAARAASATARPASTWRR